MAIVDFLYDLRTLRRKEEIKLLIMK